MAHRVRGQRITPVLLLLVLFAACGESSSPLRDAQTRPPATPAVLAPTIATLPAETVVPAPATPTPASATSPAAEVGLPPLATDDPRRAAMLAYLENLASTGQFMGSVLVADGPELLVDEGFGLADIAAGRPNTPTTQLRIGSLSKAFTAVAIMHLVDQGHLSVNDPLAKFLPNYPGGEAITIRHLLTHTAGIPNYEERTDLRQVVATPIALEDLIASFANQPLLFAPGQGYAYSSSGYVLLSRVIEVVSGLSYAEFLQTEVLQPAGMTRSGYDFLDPALPEPAVGYQLTPQGAQPAILTDSSWPSGAGALFSTAEDMYRWDRALASDGLLTAGSREALFAPQVAIPASQGAAYGYGWEIGTTAGRPSIAHGGGIFGFASYIARFPQEEAVIIVLSNGIQMPPRRIVDQLAAILFGRAAQ